jgi:uncharacterized membrane protein
MQTGAKAATKMNTRMNTKNLVISALFIAISFVGANIKVFGTVAFDSMPGFLAALLLGPVYGAGIGLLGHLLTALTSGFPLSVPMHIVVALSMALTMLGFGYTYKLMKGRVSEPVNLAITGVVGILLNGPFSLAVSIGAMAVMAGTAVALGLLAMLPALIFAAVVNVLISICLFKALEKPWNQMR